MRRGWRLGLLLAAVALGMVLGAFVSGGLTGPSGASTAQPVGPDVGDIRVGATDAGPTDTVDGVGVGFARNEPGAVAAATNLVLTVEQAAITDREAAIDAYRILAAEASEESMAAEMAATWDALNGGIEANGPTLSSLFIRTVPVGHQVVRYADDRATVEVWTLTIVTVNGLVEPLSSWETAVVELVWEQDDWKVWSATSADGPTPGWSQPTVTDTEAFLREVADLEGYRYVSHD